MRIPMWLFLNLYLQQVRGYGAFEGGAALLPMTAAIMLLMVVVAPKVVARLGFKTPIVLGMLLLATGMALAFIPSLGTAISSARPEEGGLASGIVNTSYQVGSALGLAAMTALAGAQGADRIGDIASLTDGYSAAFPGAAGITAAGAALAAVLLRAPKATPVSRRSPARRLEDNVQMVGRRQAETPVPGRGTTRLETLTAADRVRWADDSRSSGPHGLPLPRARAFR